MTIREFVPQLVDTIRILRDPNITEDEAAKKLAIYSAGIMKATLLKAEDELSNLRENVVNVERLVSE